MLEEEKVREAVDLIKMFYRKGYPAVIAWSGGKDSSTVFQLFAMALTEIPLEERIYTVYLEWGDTLLEAPPVKDYVVSQLDAMRLQIKQLRLPIEVVELKPVVEDTFFVNIIGRGYSVPDASLRWCTDRLKIKPTSRFMQERLKECGSVYIVTGARSAESANRARTLNRHTLDGKIKTNAAQAGSFMFTPIEDWTTEEVWDFLRQNGLFNNEAIEKLYEDSNPNKDVYQGNRHGCWCCTVVNNDKALEQFVQSGYELTPLLEYRAYLKSASFDPANRHLIRRKGKTVHSLLTISARIRLLERLLFTQQEVGYELISKEELSIIDTLWQADQAPITVKQLISRVRKGIKLTDQISFNFTPPVKVPLEPKSGTLEDLFAQLWEPKHYVEVVADHKGVTRIRKGNGDWVSINRSPVWAIREEEDLEYDIESYNMGADFLKFMGFGHVSGLETSLTSSALLDHSTLMENSFWHISKEADGIYYCTFGMRIPSKFGGIHHKVLGMEKGQDLTRIMLLAREKFLANDKVFKVIPQAQAVFLIDGVRRKTRLNQETLDRLGQAGNLLTFFMALQSIRADFLKLTFDPGKVNAMGLLMLRSFAYIYGGFYDIHKRALSWALVPAHNIQEYGGMVAIALGESVVKVEIVKSKYKYNRMLVDKYEQNRAQEEADWASLSTPVQGVLKFA